MFSCSSLGLNEFAWSYFYDTPVISLCLGSSSLKTYMCMNATCVILSNLWFCGMCPLTWHSCLFLCLHFFLLLRETADVQLRAGLNNFIIRMGCSCGSILLSCVLTCRAVVIICYCDLLILLSLQLTLIKAQCSF